MLLTPDGEWLELLAGDAVLLPRGGAHALASEPDAIRQPFAQWQSRPLGEDVYDPSAMETGSNCLLFYGSKRFNPDNLHRPSDLGQATVHEQFASSDETAVRRRQEQSSLGQILRLAPASQWDHPSNCCI